MHPDRDILEEPRLTPRSQAKADRRRRLLGAAATLIAERGYAKVRLDDIGAAAGISGPAMYRHFPNKEAVLAELLVGISHDLFTGGSRVVESATDPVAALTGLVEFHLDFALGEPDLIRVQDRDLASLPDPAHREVRRYQRRYVELWVQVLSETDPGLSETEARTKAHATFGLINSTPHSVGRTSPHITRDVLRRMTMASLAPGV